ncbi:glycosyltransferase [Pseudomonas monteilii]|uniref:Glycosyltransferase n=1 Tax=Pseudomonas monteilii TaxID=76759 RepID=A0A7X3JTG8_9PSED|nr:MULTISPECIES: glycosyltransferase [Pseudomonas]MBI6918975.1 glycosyltransferase [Pseudomonas monteilii]MCA4074655.1 glycosyltransferase [Pseudomonas kurunegalensis]MCE0937101.1 glycosyltransferase [Pseudomonas kurunegalensis]MDT3745676.1 glycosyltransferase [Pseudomonas kurunegalensis]MVF52071.1 glycosyltransferase [Pseudomonas monteilii]
MIKRPVISVIIPCYNAIDKIGKCFSSLRNITLDASEYEVIFVDDRSTDGTYELINKAITHSPNWRAFCLDSNSGSPSKPRNVGIEKSSGKYIYFLDCDDQVTPTGLETLYKLAEATKADLIRSELLVDNGKSRNIMNRLRNWSQNMTIQQRRTMIISGQSTTVDSFVRRDVLVSNNIYWPEHLRMGEDTIFLSALLANSQKIEYLAAPSYIYNRLPALTPASTQRYGRRELTDHLEVWGTAQKILAPAGVDYRNCRLNVGLRVAIESMIFKNRGDIDENTFHKLAVFLNENRSLVSSFNYIPRTREVVDAVQQHNYAQFKHLSRPRLLIAGYDLKFISDAIPELSNYFDIRIDQWTGHATHDEIASRELLKWAEYVWCEWLLGNAEWYSHNVRPEQKLVIRMHRMELGRSHGERLAIKNVDAVIAVSTFFFERLLERFPSIPRKKARLVHNYVRTERYKSDWSTKRSFTLGMIGILPAKKGLYKGLTILNELKKIDERFEIKIFGHRAEDIPWILKDAEEMKYFQKCKDFICQHELNNSVHFLGHQDIGTALESEGVGYILSTSEGELGFPGFESFHLAVADGFAAGGVSLVLSWPGSEYVWPQDIIHYSIDSIVSKILKLSQSPDEHKSNSRAGLKFIEKNYDYDSFVQSVVQTYLEI